MYGGRDLRRAIRALGMGYVLAVRANHTLTLGSGRTLTAAGAVKLIPHGAWQRMRTGHGTKGSRHYDWAMLEVTSDDAPGGHHGTRDAGRSAAAGPPPPLYRHLLVLPMLDTRAGPAAPADRHRRGQVAD